MPVVAFVPVPIPAARADRRKINSVWPTAASPTKAVIRRLVRWLLTAPCRQSRPARLRFEPLEDRVVPDGRPLPFPVIAVGPGFGAGLVKLFDADTGAELINLAPFENKFLGGIRVAVADLTHDGFPDLVTAAGFGGGPHVRTFDGKTGQQLPGPIGNFFAYDPSFLGGVQVAAGDVTGDGWADVVTAADQGGGPHVKVFDGKTGQEARSFFAFEPAFQGGVRLAVGDFTGDKTADLVLAAGVGGAPRVRVLDGETLAPVGDFYAFDPAARGGVHVATGDVTGDGQLDVVAGAGLGLPGVVKAFSGATGTAVMTATAFGGPYYGGVRVGTAYVDDDAHADIVAGTGTGVSPRVRTLSGATSQQVAGPAADFDPGVGSVLGGVNVAAGNDPIAVTLTFTLSTSTPAVGQTVTVSASATFSPAVDEDFFSVDWGDGVVDFTPTVGGEGITADSQTLDHTYASAEPYSGAVVATGTIGGAVPDTGWDEGYFGVKVSELPPDGAGGTCPPPLGAGRMPPRQQVGLFGPLTTRGGVKAGGVATVRASDLGSSGFGGAWGQDRSWSNDVRYSAGSAHGGGWVDGQQPHLLRTGSSLVLIEDAWTATYFDGQGTPDGGGNYPTYTARHGDPTLIAFDSGNTEFVIDGGNGGKLRFSGFASSLPGGQQGSLKSRTEPGGAVTEVFSRDSMGRPTEVRRSATVGGQTLTESYLSEYLPGTNPNAGLLWKATLRRQGGSWGTVRKVEYSYYTPSESGGNVGDLERATVTDAAGGVLDQTYYRYYTADTAPGYKGGLKYALGAEAYAQLKAATGGTDAGVETASDSTVAQYADQALEYDSSKRVTELTVSAAGCSMCSGGQGTYTYTYSTSSNSAGYNSWATKTVETLPDGNQATYYANVYGQVMLEVYKDTTTTQEWRTFRRYDASGRVVLEANPSAVTGHSDTYADLVNYQSGNAQYLADSSGLVSAHTYYTTTTATDSSAGSAAGFQQDASVRQGETGTDVKQAEWTYFRRTAGGATATPVAAETRYRNTNGTGGQTTSHAYAWQSGTTQAESVTTTLPTVTTSQNGPGTAATSTVVYDTNGRPVWAKDAGGFLTYAEYDTATGAVTKSIADVDTDLTSDFANLPGGWSNSTGLHLKATYEVDALGRATKATDPAGHVTYRVFDDDSFEVRTYHGWDATTGRPTGPTVVVREDRANRYTETLTMSATPALEESTDDFSAAQPGPGWSFVGGTWQQAGGVLAQTATVAGDPKKAVLTDRAWAADQEVEARVRVDSWTSGDYARAGVGVRTDSSTGLGYNLVLRGTNTVQFLNDNVAWGNAYTFNWQVGTWYRFKLRAVGTTLLGKVWADGQAEPADWMYTQTGWSDRAGGYPALNGGSAQTGAGNSTASFDDLRAAAVDRPTGTEAIGSIQSLSRSYRNAAGQTTYADAYFNLSGLTYTTATSLGTLNTHFYRTTQDYDQQGRPNRTVSQAGTIYRTVIDGQGRAVSEWVGTDDTPTSGFWSPTNLTGTDMVKVREYEYDGGGVGDSNLTKVTDIPGLSAASRVTQTWYDWRNRPVLVKGGVEGSEGTGVNRPLTYAEYDNLSQVVASELYDGDAVTVSTTSGVPNRPSSSLLRAKSTAEYDELGRAFRTKTYSVDLATGSVSSDALTTNTWFDLRGYVIKTSSPGGLVQKVAYDGAGRATIVYTTDGGGDSGYSDADDVTGDAVLEQAETEYDANSNPVKATVRQRFHDEADTGALGTPTTGVNARVSYSASYYDLADRPTASVDVGTNGGSSWTRPGTVPSRSDTVLVTDYVYDAAGRVWKVTDPKGLEARTEYDALGRTTKTTENYVNGTVSDTDDKTTEYGYGPAGMTSLTAKLTGGGVQTTGWVYGVTQAGGSAITSNDVVGKTQWPDPATGAASTSEQETVTVNALGQTVTSTDRNGNVHTLTYDVLGRVTSDAVTTLGSGVDGAVRRIETAYDGQGNPYLVTSYDAASSGSVVNQVKREFNGLGQLTSEWQEHAGAVTGSSLRVQYAYTLMTGGANHSRPTSVTYPNGKVLTYNYSSGLNAGISRLSSLSDTGGSLESYDYLGLGTVVRRAHDQPGVDLTYVKLSGESAGDAGDQYTGLDRFGRVVDQRWIDRTTPTPVTADRFQYTYDRNSNRTARTNVVNSAFNETYTYDGLNQLASFARGTHTQSWDYDALGNWDKLTTDGVDQNRTHNRQNEVTAVGAGTPTFDANGNMTTDETGKQYVYDAWNRLKVVKDSGGSTLKTYAYDGLNRRVSEAAGGTTTDLYYSDRWQVLEERVGGVTKAQYVWSPVYVDALVVKDWDHVGNGTLNARGYAVQDANWNTTALVDDFGAVVERYAYDPFGAVTVLDTNWAADADGVSDFAWTVLFQGLRQDQVTGNYHARNRDYSPTLGRWVTTDPIQFAAGDSNLYRFVANTPVNTTDPLGLVPVIPVGVGHAVDISALLPIFAGGPNASSGAFTAYRMLSENIHRMTTYIDLLRDSSGTWNRMRLAIEDCLKICSVPNMDEIRRLLSESARHRSEVGSHMGNLNALRGSLINTIDYVTDYINRVIQGRQQVPFAQEWQRVISAIIAESGSDWGQLGGIRPPITSITAWQWRWHTNAYGAAFHNALSWELLDRVLQGVGPEVRACIVKRQLGF